MRLKNKVAIVTGAAGGMGFAIVDTFLREGAQVVAADVMTKKLLQLQQVHPERLSVQRTDITNETAVNQLTKEVTDQFTQLDILVNAAGVAQAATPLESVSLKEWNRMMSVNVTATFLTCRAFVPVMKKQNSGVIVNIASIAAERPRPGLNAYIASKGAAVAFTKALALELAPYRIRANVINPGPTDTEMLGKFAPEGTDAAQTKKETFESSVPLGSLIHPSDIANAALYLCSEQSRHVTGAVFNIDGGRGL